MQSDKRNPPCARRIRTATPLPSCAPTAAGWSFTQMSQLVQAGIYRAMALLSEQGGDADQAAAWNGVADNLDPALDQFSNGNAEKR